MPQPFLDACALAALVRDGATSPTELVDDAIDRIGKLNPELNAVIRTRFDEARLEAAAELPDGPFRGVPIVLKDLLCYVAGEEVHEGMQVLKKARYVAPRHQELAQRLRAAGFIVVGRTNTPELGILPTTEPVAYGPTRNPWDTARSTGGSSGGSAAAVAVGHGARRACQRRGRVHPHPGQRVRARGAQALPGARPPRPRVGRPHGGPGVRAGRDQDRARHRRAARRRGGPRSRGPLRGAPSHPPLPRGGGCAPRAPARRDAERCLRRGCGDAPRLRGRHRGGGICLGVARPCGRADPRGRARRPRVHRDLSRRVGGGHRLRPRPLLARQAGPAHHRRRRRAPHLGARRCGTIGSRLGLLRRRGRSCR